MKDKREKTIIQLKEIREVYISKLNQSENRVNVMEKELKELLSTRDVNEMVLEIIHKAIKELMEE